MRIALVHDWLTGMRGGEKVLEELCRLYPEAPLFTLVHVPGAVSPVIEDRRIVTSALSRVPGIATSYRRFLPLFPRLIESLDLSGHDRIVSTSSCVAKGVRVPDGATHLSYVHSPMRYVWDRFDDYFGPGRTGALTRLAMRWARPGLKRWDVESTDRVDEIVANSAFVAARIRRFWGREAEIIPAPVDTERFVPTGRAPTRPWLVVSAFAPYKRVEVAIEAAAAADVPLVVVGKGPEEARLRARAGANVEFRGWIGDEDLAELYAESRGLLFPGVEDFGITPLESMAAGRPVIAYAEGGALETVVGAAWAGDPTGRTEGGTGLLVREQTAAAFAAAIREIEERPDRIRPVDCRARAEEFSRENFRRRLRAAVERADATAAPAGS